MAEVIIHKDKKFSEINYVGKSMRDREFYNCYFTGCDFTKSDLGDITFSDCIFDNCNFTMVLIVGTSFEKAHFKGCKVLGVDFTQCNKFVLSFRFENCIMEYSSFYKLKLKQTTFKDCNLTNVDFSEADLSLSDFSNSDLTGAQFHNTNLEKADFRSAINFSIDPEINKIKKAKFSEHALEGLLHKYQLDIY